MPIYGYQCSGCGHQKDVLQKLADPSLTECPACGADTFARQVSAPAFQLKGSGWYVTDFRDGDKGKQAGQKDTEKSGGEKSSESSDSGSATAGDSSKAASSDSKNSGSSDKSSSPAPAAPSTGSSTSK